MCSLRAAFAYYFVLKPDFQSGWGLVGIRVTKVSKLRLNRSFWLKCRVHAIGVTVLSAF